MNEEMAPWVLVESPAPGSAEFLGRWLLAAADADRELHDQYARNPPLKHQISRLEVVYCVSFSPPATKFIDTFPSRDVKSEIGAGPLTAGSAADGSQFA